VDGQRHKVKYMADMFVKQCQVQTKGLETATRQWRVCGSNREIDVRVLKMGAIEQNSLGKATNGLLGDMRARCHAGESSKGHAKDCECIS
jgi:hypothetical protein